MDLRHLPHLNKTARRIHAAIKSVAVFSAPPVSYTTDGSAETAVRLMRQRFRKPLMTNAKAWVQQLLLNEFEAYAFFSQYIELKISHQHWTSWGMLVHPLDELNPDVAKVLLGNIGPCYLRIDLSQFSVPFQELLENLKPSNPPTKQARDVA